MAKKGYKIKRYRNGKGRKGSSLTRTVKYIFFTTSCIFLIFIGFFIVGPFIESFMDSTKAESGSNELGYTYSNETSTGSQGTASKAPAISVNDKLVVFMPDEIASSPALVDGYLAEVKKLGATAVAVTVKSENGTLLFRSGVSQANAAKAQGSTDVAVLVAKIKGAGLEPIAKMHAFNDHSAAWNIQSMAVKYKDADGNPTDYLWVNREEGQPDRAWLNANNEQARNYVQSLAFEVADFGFKEIMMQDISFPTAGGLRYCYYGQPEEEINKAQVLGDFAAKLKEELGKKGCNFSVMMNFTTALGKNDAQLGGNAFAAPVSTFYLEFDPNEMATSQNIGGTYFKNPGEEYGKSVDATLRFAATKTSQKLVPVLVSKTEEEVAALSKELDTQGIKSIGVRE